MKRNVAAAAGTAQPVQGNKNTTYLYTAGRCFILLDPHRPGWLPWRQGKTPLWGRWSLGTQREWSASHEHAWLLSTQHYPPPPWFCCPSAISPPHVLWHLQVPGAAMAPVPPPLLSATQVSAGSGPVKLESATLLFPKEPVSKHEAPHSCVCNSNPAQFRVTSSPTQPAARGHTAQGPAPGWHRKRALLPFLPHCAGLLSGCLLSPRLLGPGMDLNFK